MKESKATATSAIAIPTASNDEQLALRRTREKLEGITEEVAELHPLLRELLPRLPNVLEVEYNQGPHEMGADFVLEVRNETLAETNHVGVIAKVGKIHQNTTEIERQIEECEMPRKFRNGKKEIRLSSVWVVNTASISHNAKEKIHHKYAARSVSFLDGERLAALISKHAPYCWQDLPPRLASYLHEVSTRVGELDRQASLLSSQDKAFYIELDVVEASVEPLSRKHEPLLVTDIVPVAGKVTLVQADMGAGKSKLLRRMAQHYSDALIFQEQRLLPMMVTCRELMRDFNGDAEDYARSQLAPLSEAPESDDLKVLLLIDGLDEALESDDPHTLRELFNNASRPEWLRTVIAARPSQPLESAALAEKNVTRLEIKPLTLRKIAKFIEQVCLTFNVSTRLLEDVRQSELFRKLPQTPIAAILLSRLITEDRQDLPSGLTELYDKALELMLGRWDIQKGLETDKEYTAAVKISGEIAQFILDNNLESIATNEAKSFFSSYLENRNLEIDADELFEKVTRRSGVLVRDDSRGIVKFRHRSFAEFLFAKNHKDHGKPLPVDDKYFHSYWMTTRFFYVGLLKDCPEVLTEIMAYPAPNLPTQWMKVLVVPNYLLSAMASPYSITEDNLHKLMLEAAVVYRELKQTDEHGLDRLSEGELLWFFQVLLRHAYSYRFFGRAMDSAAVRVLDQMTDDEDKMYASFFLALVAKELGNSNPLALFSENFEVGMLPIAISGLLRAELKHDEEKLKKKKKEVVPAFRRQLKRINKLFKANPNMQAQWQVVFETPIKSRQGFLPKKE